MTRSLGCWCGAQIGSSTCHSEYALHGSVYGKGYVISSTKVRTWLRFRLRHDRSGTLSIFVDLADAVRAKEDVLNGQTVRIGFGKADSTSAAPGKGAGTCPSMGTSSPTTGKNAAHPSMSDIDARLQSTPTRALWIGSIPSHTTPGTILSVFSPYGPIESARALTHKNCGFINFEWLDDAVRARKVLNGCDVLGSDVGAIRIGFANVPVKNGQYASMFKGSAISV
jgi:hypothetical protein